MYEKESEIAERVFAAIKNEDVEAINRGLNDFASIGWKTAVIYRFITRSNDRLSVITSKNYDLLFLVNGKFDLQLHKKYMRIFEESHKDKRVFAQNFKHRNEMSPEELIWLNSATPDEIISFKEYIEKNGKKFNNV